MRLRMLAISSCILVALALSACTPMDSGSSSMPGTQNRLTDIGNPNEEAELANKGIYINEEFEVRIDYPSRWSVDERDMYEAKFESDMNESITASFVELEEGENFESFLADVHGNDDDLIEMSHPDFDNAVCAGNEIVSGMIAIECYYHRSTEDGSFVMVFAGMTHTTQDIPSVSEFTVIKGLNEDYQNKTKSQEEGSKFKKLQLNDSDNETEVKTDGPQVTVTLIPGVLEKKQNEEGIEKIIHLIHDDAEESSED